MFRCCLPFRNLDVTNSIKHPIFWVSFRYSLRRRGNLGHRLSYAGTTMDSKWLSWRTALLAACILSVMVNTSYSASLVSSLLNTPTKTIRTARDLIESSLQFAAENISYSIGLFAVSNHFLLPDCLK